MPFALIFVAVALLVAAFRGTQQCLFTLVKSDITSGFFKWGAAILLIGALGYVKALAPVSTALIVLLIVVLFLKNGGFFTQASQALNTVNAQTPQPNLLLQQNTGSLIAPSTAALNPNITIEMQNPSTGVFTPGTLYPFGGITPL